MLCKQSCLCEILYGKIEGFGEGLNERAAAGGTGFVEKDIVDRMVFDADALHILAADIEDTVYLGVEEGGGIIMGNGLDLTLIQKKGCLEQGLAVAGGTAADDSGVCGEQAVDLGH